MKWLTYPAVALAAASSAVVGASKCTMVRIEEWPVRLVGNHVLVEGAINGRKIGVMLDTGSVQSLVLRSSADRLELPRQEVKGYRMFGIGGETQVQIASIDDFRIGQASRKDWQLYVAGEHDFGEGVDLILGEDFLHAFDVEFDLAHDAVRLFQAKDCDGVSLTYWTTDVASEVEIERVSDARPEIVLAVKINDQPVRAKLDSGAYSSVLSKREAAALGVTPETPGVVAAGKSRGLGANAVDNWVGSFQSFAIGNETIRNTWIRFADLYKDTKYTYTGSQIRRNAEPQQPMLLGVDFLRAHRVLVAHSRSKLYFTYVGGPVFEQPRLPPRPAEARPEGAAPPSTGSN